VPGLLETWTQQIGWRIRKGNVVVEGENDVALLEHTRSLYHAERGIDIFEDFAVLAAGHGDDGGVDGVNRRLNAARQLAEADVTNGAPQARFIGLFDNDQAGRRALSRACGFDRRIVRYQDVFLLHPGMPSAMGSPGPVVEKRAQELNRHCKSLDWEIEDLLSPDLMRAFQADYPDAIVRETTVGGATHRDLTRPGKARLKQYVRKYAGLQDVMGLVRLTRALRDYARLRQDHISL